MQILQLSYHFIRFILILSFLKHFRVRNLFSFWFSGLINHLLLWVNNLRWGFQRWFFLFWWSENGNFNLKFSTPPLIDKSWVKLFINFTPLSSSITWSTFMYLFFVFLWRRFKIFIILWKLSDSILNFTLLCFRIWNIRWVLINWKFLLFFLRKILKSLRAIF